MNDCVLFLYESDQSTLSNDSFLCMSDIQLSALKIPGVPPPFLHVFLLIIYTYLHLLWLFWPIPHSLFPSLASYTFYRTYTEVPRGMCCKEN